MPAYSSWFLDRPRCVRRTSAGGVYKRLHASAVNVYNRRWCIVYSITEKGTYVYLYAHTWYHIVCISSLYLLYFRLNPHYCNTFLVYTTRFQVFSPPKRACRVKGFIFTPIAGYCFFAYFLGCFGGILMQVKTINTFRWSRGDYCKPILQPILIPDS